MTFNPETFLSAEGARLRESAIRKMGALLAQSKDLVSFAPGYPAEDLFPWEEFRGIAEELLHDIGRIVERPAQLRVIPDHEHAE